MALERIQFAAHSYQDRSLPVSAQRLVNLYLEAKPQGSKSAQALHGTPGLALFATCGSGPIRGILGMGEYLYVVSGLDVYRVSSGGTATLAGTVTGLRPVSMAHNGSQVAIVSDVDIFAATSTTLAQLSVSNCHGVTVQDGYALFAERNTQKFFISALNDLTTFDATEFALANAVPDNCMGIMNVNRETWVFGQRTVQVYYNSGNADFPFSRISAGVIQRGTVAPRSIAELDGRVYWLGDDLRVYASNGYQPVAISTHAIDKTIAGYASPQDSVGFAYSQEGHSFYVLSFAEGTWAYDASTGLWHERVSDGLSYWRARSYARHFSKHLVGDAVNGNVYELDLDTYTDNGSVIRRLATSPPIHASLRRATMSRVAVDIETGVGLATGQGSDPQAMLRWSNDGGRSWSSELWRSFGAQGAYRKRIDWFRLGQFRQRSLELSVSDPVKVAILDVFVDVEGGIS
jgi:hypothetical protein